MATSTDLIGEHPFRDERLNRVWQMRGSYAGTALDILMWEARVREILDGTHPLDAAKPTGVPLR